MEANSPREHRWFVIAVWSLKPQSFVLIWRVCMLCISDRASVALCHGLVQFIFCMANVLCGFERFMLLSMARTSFCRNLVVVLLSPRTSVESRSLVVRFLSLRCGSHVCYSELRGMPVVVAILETYPAVAPQRSACCCEPLGLLYKRTASAEQFLLLRAILTLLFFL